MFQLLFVEGLYYSILDLDTKIRYMGNVYLQEAINNYSNSHVIRALPKSAIVLASADSPYKFNVTHFPELFI